LINITLGQADGVFYDVILLQQKPVFVTFSDWGYDQEDW
jgi:hypothetical protein